MRQSVGGIFHAMLHLLSLQDLDRSRDVVCLLSLQDVEVRVFISHLRVDLTGAVNRWLATLLAFLSLNLLLESPLEIKGGLRLQIGVNPLTVGTLSMRRHVHVWTLMEQH